MNITEKSVLKWMREKTNRPMKVSELVKCLSIPDSQRREFRNILKELAQGGRLVKIRGGRFGLPDEMSLVLGMIQGHPNGYGFLVSDDSNSEDIYIPRRNMAEAMHKDRVLIRVEAKRPFEKPEGRVIRILERRTSTVVGIFENFEGHGWVIPSESKNFHHLFIPSKYKKKAKNGQLVCAEITDFPSKHQPPTGKIMEVLGDSDEPEVKIQAVFRKFDLMTEFSYEVLQEARRLPPSLDLEEKRKRQDLTDWMIFTIDGEKAKDFDDAVSLKKTDSGFQLGVHIADVSHYVEENSLLDKEAYNRGTSVYYADGVIPMLPFELSNELCSLKPHFIRPTLTALMDYDIEGNILNTKIFNSFIKSKKRFTYTEVQQLLDHGDPKGAYTETFPSLILMHKFSQRLRKRRFKNGSVDFQIPEPEIVLNNKGDVERIRAAEHNEANQLIEEFMLQANQAVAKHICVRNIPGIHRIHLPPDLDKLEGFNDFLKGFGLKLSHLRDIRSPDLQKLVTKVRGKPFERVVNSLLLRTMKKAEYSPNASGHFCLNFEHYTHFTSPIRRYPDLITHRTLKSFLHRKPTEKQRNRLISVMADYAIQSSTNERKAMEVEREIQDLRRCQFMIDKIGKNYHGIISSVTSFGFFVELTDYFVEGLVRLSSMLDDYYIFLETEHLLKGQHRHKTYQIGDSVKIRVSHVDIAKRYIDFILIS